MVDVTILDGSKGAAPGTDHWRTMHRVNRRPKRWGRLHDSEIVWKVAAPR